MLYGIPRQCLDYFWSSLLLKTSLEYKLSAPLPFVLLSPVSSCPPSLSFALRRFFLETHTSSRRRHQNSPHRVIPGNVLGRSGLRLTSLGRSFFFPCILLSRSRGGNAYVILCSSLSLFWFFCASHHPISHRHTSRHRPSVSRHRLIFERKLR